MNNSAIKDIIAQKKVCYFISPHFDDMIFSASALATELTKTNKVVVINIFTTAGDRHTLSAKAYLKQCGYQDATKLYKDRKIEDKLAIAPITKSVIDLGFREALWRNKPGNMSNMLGRLLPELGSTYPTYRLHISKGRIARTDKKTVDQIKAKLKEIIEPANAAIFCPMGIGNHVDHIITHEVCKSIFDHPIFWADYPYIQTHKVKNLSKNQFSYAKNKDVKTKYIHEYKTQYKAMFGNEEPKLNSEQFYINEGKSRPHYPKMAS